MSLAVVSAIIGLFGATGTGQAAGDAPQGEAHELSVRVEGGLVSAEMVNAPLGQAVAELARQTGFELVLEGKFDRRVSLKRSDMEIAELLGELLQNCSWFLVSGSDGAGTQDRISQVWILKSPQCENPSVAGDEGESQHSARMRRVQIPTSVIRKDDVKERQQNLGRVINGQARASMDELLEAARNDREVSIKILALMALGRSGGPEAKATLVEALSDDNLAVRTAAVRSLARGWSEEAVAHLNRLLSSETEVRVVRAAVQQLRQIGTDAAWDGLRRAADSDNAAVNSLAQKALAQLEAENQTLTETQ